MSHKGNTTGPRNAGPAFTTYSCQICKEVDNMQMVMCDTCNLWHHYACVGVTADIENSTVPWSCPRCAPSPERTASKKTASSKASSRRRRTERELAALEEQRTLQKQLFEERAKADAEYIKKKLEIQQQLSSEDDVGEEGDDNTELDEQIATRTQQWVSSSPRLSEGAPSVQSGHIDQISAKELAVSKKGSGHYAPRVMSQPDQPSSSAHATDAISLKQQLVNSTLQLPMQSVSLGQQTNLIPSSDVYLPNMHQQPNINYYLSANQQSMPGSSSATQLGRAPAPTYSYLGVPGFFRTAEETQTGQAVNTAHTGERYVSVLPTTGVQKSAAPQPPLYVQHTAVPPTTGIHNFAAPLLPSFAPSYSAVPTSVAQRTYPAQPPPSGFAQPAQVSGPPPTTVVHCGTIPALSTRPSVPIAQQHQYASSLYQNYGEQPLTSRNFAARHALPKDLPTFSGKPEEWPIFISAFERSTITCGFSQEENLVRLQKCLKGKALDAVSSRLILPSGLPQVIATLHQLFGRPELIVHNLLMKVRNEPQPKIDKMETIVNYSMAVQNLCATMEVCGLTAHLCNPLLLQELVDKLPPQMRLNWATHTMSQPYVNLTIFSNWLSQIAAAASSILLPETKSSRNHVNAHTNDKQPSTSSSTPIKRKCLLCNSDHHITVCSQFISLEVSQRWNIVKEKKLCRRCLGQHSISRCKSKSVCGKESCQFKHHQLLHNSPKMAETDPKSAATNTHQQTQQSVLFRVVPVVLHGKSKSVHTFAFLDEGSSLTLLEDDIAEELQLNGTTESLCLRWTSDQTRMEPESRNVSLEISARDDIHRYKLNNVRTVKNLSLPEQSISAKDLKDKFPHLKGIPIHTYERATPKILIGIDHSKLGLPLNVREGKWMDPIGIETRLGWTVHGCYNHRNCSSSAPIVHHSFHACECKSDDSLHRMVKEFFEVDNACVMGIAKMESDEDIRAKAIMERTTIRDGDRYETGLLWKYDRISLPDSYPMARRRLTCLEKKMAANEKLSTNLHQQIKDYISKGYARKLTPNELRIQNTRKWYLPIFAVTNPNKPGKTRLVWDAAAKVDGISLNSVLLKGPDQLASLPKVLFGLREKRIAICGDIREMFHQVRVKKEDQHSQRFLWRDEACKEPNVFVMQAMTFGASCSPCSAQFVKNKNALQHADQHPRAVKAIVERHYVDDWLDSMDTVEEAIQLANEVKLIHSRASFEIRNWVSNSLEVLESLGQPTDAVTKPFKICADDEADKVLGMWWNTSNDVFIFKLNPGKLDPSILNGKRKSMQREVLRALMSIFDPLGLIAHFLVYVKILLQEVWRSATGWDEPLAPAQNEKWQVWAHQLAMVEQVSVYRCYSTLPPHSWSSTELHTFVDASENAYAAVTYLRVTDGKHVDCALIAAKTKVSPLKQLSIPRLELQAATLGARLAKTIGDSHSFRIDRRVFWSDSRTVLSWLKSDQRRYKQFVAFRIGEILELSDLKEWRWVPTRLNVADEATKWTKSPGFQEDSRWFCGPEFLVTDEDNWPEQTSEIGPNSSLEEMKSNVMLAINRLEVPCTPDPDRFSRWQRLYSAQACVHRCTNRLVPKARRTPVNEGPYSSHELQTAKIQLYRRAQLECYTEEIHTLQDPTPLTTVSKKSSIFKLSPYLDESGILRVRGRIDAADGVDDSTKRPIILPRDHYVTRLVVSHYHIKFHHQNNETVINELRQRYAIPRVRQTLKSVKRNCQKCKNARASPHPPQMAALPEARLAAFTRPFTYTGVDYFGPFTVVIGRRSEKRWGVLFTCLTIRAIHLEIAHSLNTDSCIMCIRNFMARRGVPKVFYSDNGTNFHGTNNELKKAFNEISKEELQSTFTNSETQWLFNPPASPHMGGSWERLVGSVKKTMKQIIPTNRHPTDELLRTTFAEIENTVNSRPLTFVSVDPDDPIALTPNHFLLGSSNGFKPAGEFSDKDMISRKNWRKSQNLANHYWKRWVAEYLPTLTRRTKWYQPVKALQIGDIVIVVDDSLPRNSWPLGKVIGAKPGKDGAIRRATVQTKSGIYERPTVKLAVLDVRKEG